MLSDYLSTLLDAVEHAQLSTLGITSLIILAALISEDITILTTAAFMQMGHLSPSVFILGNLLGIIVGDIMLYTIGYKLSGRRHKLLGFELQPLKDRAKRHQNKGIGLIIAARFFPGTRLPIKVAAGLSHYPFIKFFIAVLCSSFIWVGIFYTGSQHLTTYLMVFDHPWLSLIAFIVGGYILIHIVAHYLHIFSNHYRRRAWFKSWRKYFYYEFWPMWAFYPPVFFYYLYLCLRFRSITLPAYANPSIENSGLIGESKAKIFELVPAQTPQLLKYTLIQKNAPLTEKTNQLTQFISTKKLNYPIILKPDIGQRGGGVHLVRNQTAAHQYLHDATYPVIAQEYCPHKSELGLFYAKLPGKKPSIFSTTGKIFPTITGDGHTTLGDLILQDRRAGMIASTYFKRFADQLDTIPAKGKTIKLVESGNHCQGSIFEDHQHLVTPKTQNHLFKIAQSMPGFYIGRFDIRYESMQQLEKGHFKIIEINAAGSEATHIYDAKLPLAQAYKALFQQWRYLCIIGQYNRHKMQKTSLWSVFKALLEYLKNARHYDVAS